MLTLQHQTMKEALLSGKRRSLGMSSVAIAARDGEQEVNRKVHRTLEKRESCLAMSLKLKQRITFASYSA